MSEIYYNNQLINIENARKIIQEGNQNELVIKPSRGGFRWGQLIYEFENGYGASYVNNELAITVHRNCENNFQLYYPDEEPWNGDSVCYDVVGEEILQGLLSKIIMYPDIPEDMKLCKKDQKTFIHISNMLSPNGIIMLNRDIEYDKEEIQEIKDGVRKSYVYTLEELREKLFERIKLLEKAKKDIYHTLKKQIDTIVYQKAKKAYDYYPEYNRKYKFIECNAYSKLGTKIIYIRKKDFNNFPVYDEVEDEHAVMKGICNVKNITTVKVPKGKSIVETALKCNTSDNYSEFLNKRIHIQCERLDKEKKYKELLDLLNNSKYKKEIINHIQNTLGCLHWNIIDGDSDGGGKLFYKDEVTDFDSNYIFWAPYRRLAAQKM